MNAPFDAPLRTRLVFGEGAIEKLGELARELGARRALVVTDEGVASAGHAATALRSLQAADVETLLFDRVTADPTTADVDACLAAARAGGIDLFVGLGGGSSIDTAKGANFLLTNGGRMADYWGSGKATRAMLPLIAVPTTAGTGSEVQSYALIADEASHAKMACGDPKASPRVALLDPCLTLSQPRDVAAACGLDTVTHAVETAVTRSRNAWSLLFSREAFRLADGSLASVLERPDDLPARGRMQLAAAFAGMAIEASMLGAAHSAANPLTAHYSVVHGRAVGMMLPAVVRYNAVDSEAREGYAALAGSVDALLGKLDALLAATGTPRTLSHYGVARGELPRLSTEAAQQWTAGHNPREVGPAAFEALYEATL